MVVRKLKDKCKDAARMRREKERVEFLELSRLLPLPSSTTNQLDKASIIRLTSSYLRMRSAFPDGLGENWGNRTKRQDDHYSMLQHQHQPIRELGSLLLQTLDGFVFAMHKDGKIMYISETASVLLGLPQIDLTGSSVFDYVHPSDHDDVREMLSLSEVDKIQLNNMMEQDQKDRFEGLKMDNQSDSSICIKELCRSFCIRMKCILPKRNAGLVTSGYKAIHCNGYLKVSSQLESSKDKQINCLLDQTSHQARVWDSYALVAVGYSLLPSASTEIKLTGDSFMFRANLDMRFCFIESIVHNLLNFEQFDMIGQSLYQFVHVSDIKHLENSHRTLLAKGQVATKYYRLMKKDGGFLWVQSYATLINNSNHTRNIPKPQHIVSICFVLGNEHSDESCFIYDKQNDQEQETVSFENQLKCTNYMKLNEDNIIKQHQLSIKKDNRRTKRASGKIRDQRSLQRVNIESCAKSINKDRIDHQGNNMISFENCSCLVQSTMDEICQLQTGSAIISTIGSTRRPSDDSCSIVSSVASTNLSSHCSSHMTSQESINYPIFSESQFQPEPSQILSCCNNKNTNNTNLYRIQYQQPCLSQSKNLPADNIINNSVASDLQQFWPDFANQLDFSSHRLDNRTQITANQHQYQADCVNLQDTGHSQYIQIPSNSPHDWTNQPIYLNSNDTDQQMSVDRIQSLSYNSQQVSGIYLESSSSQYASYQSNFIQNQSSTNFYTQ